MRLGQREGPARVLVVIPARGGSKGIPRKNLQLVGGIPLVVRAVQAARAASTVDRIVVSTDDASIARVASTAGADIVERPADLSGDTASSESALLHALEAMASRGYHADVIVMIQCTSPFIESDDVDGVVKLVLSGADSAFTAAPSHRFLWRTTPEGNAAGVNHDLRVRPRRQDRQPEFVETGAVYAMRVAGFVEARHRFFGNVQLFPVDAARAHDIDDAQDLDLARRLAVARAPPPTHLRAVAMDFDGVMTDNRVWVNQEGLEAVSCNRADGLAVDLLRRAGFRLVVLSTETNPVVLARCRKLNLDIQNALSDKGQALREWAKAQGLAPEAVLYIGNDVNDLTAFQAAGYRVAVADAHPRLRQDADMVLRAKGGDGAIRELATLLLAE